MITYFFIARQSIRKNLKFLHHYLTLHSFTQSFIHSLRGRNLSSNTIIYHLLIDQSIYQSRTSGKSWIKSNDGFVHREAEYQTWLFQGRCWGLVGWAFPWGTSRQASLMGVLLPLHTHGRCGTSSCLLASEQSDPAIWGVEWAGRWKTFLSLCNSATINENHVSFTDLHLHSRDMVLYSHPPPNTH